MKARFVTYWQETEKMSNKFKRSAPVDVEAPADDEEDDSGDVVDDDEAVDENDEDEYEEEDEPPVKKPYDPYHGQNHCQKYGYLYLFIGIVILGLAVLTTIAYWIWRITVVGFIPSFYVPHSEVEYQYWNAPTVSPKGPNGRG